MKRSNHLARWIAAGVTAFALSGAGSAAASTTPPSEPPSETSADATMVAEDTATSDSSEPMTGAGPSDCPAITADMAATTEGSGAEATTDATGTTEAVAATEAPTASEAPADTSEGTMAPDVSEPPDGGPAVQVVETDEYGPILADGGCFTLYAFTQDVDGESTCFDDCAEAWPALLVTDGAVPPLADELDPTLFSVVEHPDGEMLKIGDWPLYYFAGDANPGELNGQGVGGVWWVVAPDGTLVEGEEGASEGSEPAGSEAAGSEPADTASATTEG